MHIIEIDLYYLYTYVYEHTHNWSYIFYILIYHIYITYWFLYTPHTHTHCSATLSLEVLGSLEDSHNKPFGAFLHGFCLNFSLHVSALLEFLPWLLLIIEYNLEVQDDTNPFLPKFLCIRVFYHSDMEQRQLCKS